MAFASMFVAYYISQRLVFPHFAIGMSLGAIAGIGASLIIGMVSRDKIDLCKNGVVIVRWTFLPWKSVRLLKWNRDGNGKLLIRSGWRRLAAKVPIEHREIVDHFLQEKVGRGAPSNGEIQAAATPHEP